MEWNVACVLRATCRSKYRCLNLDPKLTVGLSSRVWDWCEVTEDEWSSVGLVSHLLDSCRSRGHHWTISKVIWYISLRNGICFFLWHTPNLPCQPWHAEKFIPSSARILLAQIHCQFLLLYILTVDTVLYVHYVQWKYCQVTLWGRLQLLLIFFF